MIETPNKQGSSVSKKSYPFGSLFSIHLLEDENGHVTVVAESVGNGLNNENLGHFLLYRLTEMEMQEPQMMTVQMPTHSAHWH